MLSKKEQERCAKTKAQLLKMKDQGYRTHEITITPVIANTLALVWGILLFLPVIIPFLYKFGNPFQYQATETDLTVTMGLYVILIIIHELIHGVCMYLFNGHKMETISYGINSGMPYCTCQAPIRKWQYIIVLLMPTIVLGIFTSILAFHFKGIWWLVLVFNMMAGGGGDLTMCSKIILEKEKDFIIIDHPYKCGFFALSKNYKEDQFEKIANNFDEQIVNDEQIKIEKAKNKKKIKKNMKILVILTIISFVIGFALGVLGITLFP